MYLTDQTYVPALRWRMGEYQALMRLSKAAKDRVVPFITIPEIEFDFDTWEPKKSVHEHIHPFAARFKAKWHKRPAWIAVHKKIVDGSMNDGRDIYSYVFEGLREFEASAVPALSLDPDQRIIRSVAEIIKRDSLGVAVAVRLEDLMQENLAERIAELSDALGVESCDVDLIVDLGGPNFEPYDAFSSALVVALKKLDNLDRFRNFVLIGTAIPETYKDIGKGFDELPRHEWLFYQQLLATPSPGLRRPTYGDYTIVHPDFTPVDMRMIKPAGKLIYTTPKTWWMRKGGAFRGNEEQMHEHCAALVGTDAFKGSDYSSGDDYIAKCAVKEVGPSNQTRWKNVAINHHITHVLDDLATLGGSA